MFSNVCDITPSICYSLSDLLLLAGFFDMRLCSSRHPDGLMVAFLARDLYYQCNTYPCKLHSASFREEAIQGRSQVMAVHSPSIGVCRSLFRRRAVDRLGTWAIFKTGLAWFFFGLSSPQGAQSQKGFLDMVVFLSTQISHVFPVKRRLNSEKIRTPILCPFL